MTKNKLIELKNSKGKIKKVKLGFSWTTLFFGPFPALNRQDGLWALIILAGLLFTGGFLLPVFAFVYNKVYLNNLLKSGYTLVESKHEEEVEKYLALVKGFKG